MTCVLTNHLTPVIRLIWGMGRLKHSFRVKRLLIQPRTQMVVLAMKVVKKSWMLGILEV